MKQLSEEIGKLLQCHYDGGLTWGELMQKIYQLIPPPATPAEADNVYGLITHAINATPILERMEELR